MRDIMIIGAGGASRDIIDIIGDINAEAAEARFAIIGVLDDDPSRHGTELHGIPVLGGLDHAAERACALVIGIASHRNRAVRMRIVERLGLPADRYATLIHPSARVSRFATVGVGSVVAQYAVIGPDVSVGAHVFVAPAVTIGHDAVIYDGAVVGPQAVVAGSVQVGSGVYIGAGVTVREGLRLGAGALLGMGSVVIRDVADGAVVAGNPARPLPAR